MARVTIEDCLEHVNNRFDLVLRAAKRAHLIEMGAVDILVDADNDKPTVIALREIAAGFNVETEGLRIEQNPFRPTVNPISDSTNIHFAAEDGDI